MTGVGEEAGASRGVDEYDGGIGSKRGVMFSGKACTRGRSSTGRRTDEVGCGADPSETKRRMPRNRLAGPGAGGWGAVDVFGDIARGYAFGRVAASTRRNYEWRLWVNWRLFVRKGCWLQKAMGEMELVAEVAESMGYCCAEKGNKETTIAGKLVVINFYHEQFMGLSLPFGNPLIKSVKQ